MFRRLLSLILFFLITITSQASSFTGKHVYVRSSTTIQLDGASNAQDGRLVIETELNRILFITIEDVDLSPKWSSQDSDATIYIQERGEVGQRLLQQSSFYSKSNSVIIGYKPSSSRLRLKIEKATGCPLNLGPSTQCDRVVDPESCYCINYEKLTWDQAKDFCTLNGMELVSIENRYEDQAIWASWFSQDFWTSLTKRGTSTCSSVAGNWFWASTGVDVDQQGYSNWCIGQPDKTGVAECGYSAAGSFCWKSGLCTTSYLSAVCEIQP